MDVTITSDANAGSGVAEVIYEISGPIWKHFKATSYGAGLLCVAVVLMCRNPELNFKRRLRFSKKEKTVYMDIMLDLEQMRRAEHKFRKRMIVERLLEEVPAVLRKYSIVDFHLTRFVEDFKGWLKEEISAGFTSLDSTVDR